MDELQAALAQRRKWYLFHADIPRLSPATLRARETGIAAPERAPPEPRDGDDEDEDDSWKLNFNYLTPVPAHTPVAPEDQRIMDEVLSRVMHTLHRAGGVYDVHRY